MSKRLVVNAQLELIAVLHYAHSVAADVPREQEGCFVPIHMFCKGDVTYFES